MQIPMRFLTWLRRKRFPYEPLINIEIDGAAITHNLREFSKLAPECRIAPVLKANAYGHGMLGVARILDRNNVPFIAVDSYFEAVALRAKHIHTPILIIGYTRPDTVRISRLRDTTFTLTSLETLRAIGQVRHTINIQLKIDTGMHRQGIRIEEIPEAIELIRETPSFNLDGVFTHFCDADNTDESYTEMQINLWNKAVARIKSDFPYMRYTHAAATDGSRYSSDIHADTIRLGIGLYGLSENPLLDVEQVPAMKVKTIITGIKTLNKGETVGYGNTFKAKNNMTIATIPIGYSEGLDTRLSNKGTVLVGTRRISCPIIGRVSMNITTIDVSKVKEPVIGMEVIVISNRRADDNSIAEIAKKCDTHTYEIAVKIPAQLKRDYKL